MRDLMTRPERFIRRAYQVSTDANCTFLVGAVVATGSRVISTGCCTSKTHPKNPKIKTNTLRKHLCAEIVAVIRAINIIPREKIKKCTVYVTRRRRNGSIGMAKPCIYCQTFLKEVGIRNIYYTNNLGEIEYLKE
jgi:cytidine deaminase